MTTSSLSIPEGFFSSDDAAEHLDMITVIRDKLLQLELQKFAFDLKDFILANRNLDGFKLQTDGTGVEFSRGLFLMEAYAEDRSKPSESLAPSADLYRRLNLLIDDNNQSHTLVNYFIDHSWDAEFENLSQASEEQILENVMRQVLWPENFSLWESAYLKQQSKTVAPTPVTPVKKTYHSL